MADRWYHGVTAEEADKFHKKYAVIEWAAFGIRENSEAPAVLLTLCYEDGTRKKYDVGDMEGIKKLFHSTELTCRGYAKDRSAYEEIKDVSELRGKYLETFCEKDGNIKGIGIYLSPFRN